MVNTPIDGKQDFDDLIDQSSTLSYDLRKSVEFIVEELRLKSQLTRSKIQQLLGAHISDRLYTRGPTTLFRNREKDEDVTEDIVAGAIAAQRSSYADVLSLDAAYDGKTIETRLRNVPTGSLLESPTSKQAKDVVKVYNFLRSASIGYSAEIPNAAEWLTNDADYNRIPRLSAVIPKIHQFTESKKADRLTEIGMPNKSKMYATTTISASPTLLEKQYFDLTALKNKIDTYKSQHFVLEKEISDLKEDIANVKNNLNQNNQSIIRLEAIQEERLANGKVLTVVEKKILDDAIATQPSLITALNDLESEYKRKRTDFNNLLSTLDITSSEAKVAEILDSISTLEQEYILLKKEDDEILKELQPLGITAATVADALGQNVTLVIDKVSEPHTLQEWIDSGRLLQFADRIQSMKIKSSRGRLSADQFLKEATMYHLFGQYKKLDEHEEQELRETMAKFVYTKPEEPPAEPTPNWFNRGANSAYTGTARRLQYVGSLPGTLAGSVKKGLKTIWKNL